MKLLILSGRNTGFVILPKVHPPRNSRWCYSDGRHDGSPGVPLGSEERQAWTPKYLAQERGY
jgi:hypothetical protein